MNKFLYFIIFFIASIFIAESCTVEKRLYNSGYHIDFRNTEKAQTSSLVQETTKSDTVLESQNLKTAGELQNDSIFTESLTASADNNFNGYAKPKRLIDNTPKQFLKKQNSVKKAHSFHKKSIDNHQSPHGSSTKKVYLIISLINLVLALLLFVVIPELAIILAIVSFVFCSLSMKQDTELPKLNPKQQITQQKNGGVIQDNSQVAIPENSKKFEQNETVEVKPGLPKSQRFNTLAIIGFVNSVLGAITIFFGIGILFLIGGMIMSSIAMRQTKKDSQKGRGLAIAGFIIPLVVFSSLLIILTFYVILFLLFIGLI